MNHRILQSVVFVLCTCCTLLSFAEHSARKEKLQVCAEDAGWPPFSFPPTQPDTAFTGFNMDVLSRVFEGQGIAFEVVIRPWKRCLHDAIDGDIDIVLDAAKNPEREKLYLLSEPVYQLTPAYFFAKNRLYDYTTVDSAAKLKSNRSVCGQSGYTYNNFGFENSEVRMVSKELSKLIHVVTTHRCDVGLTRKEVLLTEVKGTPYKDQIAYREIPNVTGEFFYYLINRNHPHANQIKQTLDQGVAKLRESGEADQLLQAYFE